MGFEPTNNGFANRRLGPLGYAALKAKVWIFYRLMDRPARANAPDAAICAASGLNKSCDFGFDILGAEAELFLHFGFGA